MKGDSGPLGKLIFIVLTVSLEAHTTPVATAGEDPIPGSRKDHLFAPMDIDGYRHPGMAAENAGVDGDWPPLQPDLWIRESWTRRWLGCDIYNNDGAGQTGVRLVAEETTAILRMALNYRLGTATLSVGDSPVGTAITPDGTTALVTNRLSDTISVVDLDTFTETTTVEVGGWPGDVAITPDGTTALVTNGNDDTVSVVDLATFTETATIPVGDNPRDLAITPDGTTALVTSRLDDMVSVVDLPTLTQIATIPVGDGPGGVAITPDGTTALVTNRSDNTVSVVDLATFTETATTPVGDYPRNVALTPDGTTALVTNLFSGNVSVLDLATFTETATIPVGNWPYGVAITPDGTTALVTNGNDDTVSVVDLATFTETATTPVGGYPRDLEITPDGVKALVADSEDDTVSLVDLTAFTETFWIQGPAGDANWTVRYYWGNTVRDDREVTAQVTSSKGWKRPKVASGKPRNFLITMTPGPGVSGSYEALVTATSKRDPTRQDAVKAIATVGDLQPDLAIRQAGTWWGQDIYNGDGTDQTVTHRGNPAVYRVRLTNDGEVPGNFWIRGPDGEGNWTVKYYWGTQIDPTRKVTRWVTRERGWKQENVAPGESRFFLISVAPNPGITGTYPVKVVAYGDRTPIQLDCIQVLVTVPKVQPDLWIKRSGIWLGDDVYNDDGTDQTRRQATPAGETAKYFARLYNDGEEVETFFIQGPAGDENWTIEYYKGMKNVTAQVTSTQGWKRAAVPPGEVRPFRIEVTPQSGLSSRSRRKVKVQVEAKQDPNQRDVIKVVTVVK